MIWLEDVKAWLENHREEAVAWVGSVLAIIGVYIKYKRPIHVILKRLRGFIMFFPRAVQSVDLIFSTSETTKEMQDRVEGISSKVNGLHATVDRIAMYRTVDEEMSDLGIFRCDHDGNNTDVNTSFCNALGATREQLMGKGWMDFVDDDEYMEKYRRAFRDGRSLSSEIKFIDIDGNHIKGYIKILLSTFGHYEGRIKFLDGID